MSWFRRAQQTNYAALLVNVLSRAATNPAVPFEMDLAPLGEAMPDELMQTISLVSPQFPDPNETQQSILWHVQRLITGEQGSTNELDREVLQPVSPPQQDSMGIGEGFTSQV